MSYIGYRPLISQIVFPDKFYKLFPCVVFFKFSLAVSFDCKVKISVKVYALITHIVKLRDKPYCKAVFIAYFSISSEIYMV